MKTWWKADLVTGGLKKSSDGVTFVDVTDVVWWKVGWMQDAERVDPPGNTIAALWVKVKDIAAAGQVQAQSSVLQLPALIPTHEFRSGPRDVIEIAASGVLVVSYDVAAHRAHDWPAGGIAAVGTEIDAPFKEGV